MYTSEPLNEKSAVCSPTPTFDHDLNFWKTLLVRVKLIKKKIFTIQAPRRSPVGKFYSLLQQGSVLKPVQKGVEVFTHPFNTWS